MRYLSVLVLLPCRGEPSARDKGESTLCERSDVVLRPISEQACAVGMARLPDDERVRSLLDLDPILCQVKVPTGRRSSTSCPGICVLMGLILGVNRPAAASG